MVRVFIDTELWSFALKIPEETTDQEDVIARHDKAYSFLDEKLQIDNIYLSTHQLHELFHALSFRGAKLDTNFTRQYIEHLLELQNVTVVSNTIAHFKKSMILSCKSGIHIWDFLCILPVINQVEIIYTCDSHFKNEVFDDFKKPIQNPLGEWLVM